MYKKRFSKWGFYKNTRQARAFSTARQSTDKRRSTTPDQTVSKLRGRSTQSSILLSPDLGRLDTLNLIFLTNIRTWCSAFFEVVRESHHTGAGGNNRLSLLLPYSKHTEAYDAEQTSFSFKLIVDLLGQGEGVLAGRLARKAFLQIEQMLLLDAPLFIWNLLEMLHSIVQSKQARLFEMLLAHLLSLARSHYSDNHSIVLILHGVWNLCKTCPEGLMQQLRAVLEQGWLLNAEIVLDNFDEHFLLLYYRLIWDSALLGLVQDKLRDVDTWFSLVTTRVPMEVINEAAASVHPAVEATHEECNALPADYDTLKTESIYTLRERTRWKFPEPTTRFRVLSALIKSRILDEDGEQHVKFNREGSEQIDNGSQTAFGHVQGKVPRLNARILAYVMKVLTEIDLDNGGNKSAVIKRMNSTIALREYGQGVADPQVIFEMWRLRHLLLQEGRFQEAADIRQEAHKRLTQYLMDIP